MKSSISKGDDDDDGETPKKRSFTEKIKQGKDSFTGKVKLSFSKLPSLKKTNDNTNGQK